MRDSNVEHHFRNTLKLSTEKQVIRSINIFRANGNFFFLQTDLENDSIVKVKSYFHISTHDLNFYDLVFLQEILFLFHIFLQQKETKQAKNILGKTEHKLAPR